MQPVLFAETKLKVCRNTIETGQSQKPFSKKPHFQKKDKTTDSFQLKNGKWFDLLPLEKSIEHVIRQDESKDYTLTLNTCRIHNFVKSFFANGVEDINRTLFAEITMYVHWPHVAF